MSVSIAAGILQRGGAKAAFAGPALLSLGGRLPAVFRQPRFLPLVGNAGKFAPLSMSADPAQAAPAVKKPKKVKVRGPTSLEVTQGQIVIQSPTDATSLR